MTKRKFRLITRSDFDGLVSAVLLRHQDLIDDILFAHPNDMQNGLVNAGENDISTNLPYVPGIHLAFDHHLSETMRNEESQHHIIDPDAASAARVIYNYYGGSATFPEAWDDMMEAVDKSDSANFSREEVLYPQGWALLNFIMDARTGLGRFKHYRISNYALMMDLIDACSSHTIDEILAMPDVQERTEIYEDHQFRFLQQLDRCSKTIGKLTVIDLRREKTIFVGNRFTVYALNPQSNLSIHLAPGRTEGLTMIAMGKSIFNRSSPVNVGALMLEYGGGGHHAVGTCQVPDTEVNQVISRIREVIAEQETASN